MTSATEEKPRLQFEAKGHIYRLDGVVREGVTQVFTALGVVKPEYYTEKSRIRGARVHQATAMLESPAGLNWDSLKPIEDALQEAIVPRVKAWDRFLKDTGWKSRLIEVPNFHKDYFYCTTIDRIGRFPDKNVESVLEVKTANRGTAKAPWWPWQTGAQELLWRSHDGVCRSRLAITLYEDGEWEPDWHGDAEDSATFLHMLASVRALHAKRILKLPIPLDA